MIARRFFVFVLTALAAASWSVRLDAAGENPDWPCVQRLVPEIAPGMIWSGPPVDTIEPSAHEPVIDELAGDLAARRVPLADAEAQIAALADSLAADQKNVQLTRLFSRALDIINRDRASLIQGIGKYARGERALAEKIAAQNAKLAELPTDQVIERDTLIAERDWDIRIYDDRRGSLTYLCDQPVLLEQRAFALARAIASHLE